MQEFIWRIWGNNELITDCLTIFCLILGAYISFRSYSHGDLDQDIKRHSTLLHGLALPVSEQNRMGKGVSNVLDYFHPDWDAASPNFNLLSSAIYLASILISGYIVARMAHSGVNLIGFILIPAAMVVLTTVIWILIFYPLLLIWIGFLKLLSLPAPGFTKTVGVILTISSVLVFLLDKNSYAYGFPSQQEILSWYELESFYSDEDLYLCDSILVDYPIYESGEPVGITYLREFCPAKSAELDECK